MEPCYNTRRRTHTRRFLAKALLGIPVLLMCSCARTPVKHYTLAFQGAPRPAEEAVLTVTEKPAIKPYVKIDGHCFSVGSELGGAVRDGFIYPFEETPMRSLQVRLLPGHHRVEVAIKWIGSWSLPFSRARTIEFDASAGKTYELRYRIIQFNDSYASPSIEWETEIVEAGALKEFASGQGSSGSLIAATTR